MAHTPGPWRVDSSMCGYDLARVFTTNEFIVFTECDDDMKLSDAHLIAAAPDLLAALKYFANLKHCKNDSEQCSMDSGPCCRTHGDNDFHADQIEIARAAIAKAEGR